MYITERSMCCEKIGINCSCFSVEVLCFVPKSPQKWSEILRNARRWPRFLARDGLGAPVHGAVLGGEEALAARHLQPEGRGVRLDQA